MSIHIYICCEVIIWSKFGVFKCYYLVQVGVFKCYYLVQVCFLTYKNSGFKRFGLHTQLSFCVFFCAQLSGNFPKIAFFKKRVQKLGFSIFSVLSIKFENSFFGLLKHYKNRGFSIFCVFCCWERRKQAKKMITGIYEIKFFWSNNGRFVTHMCFPKKSLLKPLFL